MTDSVLQKIRQLVWAGCAVIFTGILAFVLFFIFSGPPQDLCGGRPALTSFPSGGNFSLIDHTGNPRDSSLLLGKPSLLFFGYTLCPDICPDAMDRSTQAIFLLAQQGIKVQLVFVSLDSKRDTPDQLNRYIRSFAPDGIALTGSPEQLAQATAAWNVYFSSFSGSNMLGEYAIDHSSLIYLVGTDGKYLDHFTGAVSPEEMAKRAACRLSLKH